MSEAEPEGLGEGYEGVGPHDFTNWRGTYGEVKGGDPYQ